jgi:5-methylcytosine-specific restriction endonuclease McrBC GTP-binding regulatory subunit McrB
VKEKLWEPMGKVNKPQEEQIAILNNLAETFTGIDLSLLLTKINDRIEKLRSKDFMIGHAYLINVRSIKDLKVVFFNKIIPLLQEYFYGDYGRIGLVIGEAFLDNTNSGKTNFMPVAGYETGDLGDGKVYRLKTIEAFEDDKLFMDAVKAIYA